MTVFFSSSEKGEKKVGMFDQAAEVETKYILARVGNVSTGGTGITGPDYFLKAGEMRLKRIVQIPMLGTTGGFNIGTTCVRLKPGPSVVSGTEILMKIPSGLNIATQATRNHTQVLWLDVGCIVSDTSTTWTPFYKEWVNPSRKWHKVKQSDILIVETQAQFAAWQVLLLIEYETRYGP